MLYNIGIQSGGNENRKGITMREWKKSMYSGIEYYEHDTDKYDNSLQDEYITGFVVQQYHRFIAVLQDNIEYKYAKSFHNKTDAHAWVELVFSEYQEDVIPVGTLYA